MPLDPKLNKFTTASPIIATYDFVDVANGLGFQTFYVGVTQDSVGYDHVLTDSPFLGGAPAASSNLQLAGPTQTFNIDSSAFNLPRTIKGTAIILGDMFTGGNNVAVTVALQKWDGATATDITTADVTSHTTAQASRLFMELPLDQTKMSKGDVLRLEITVTTANASAGLNVEDTVDQWLRVLVPFDVRL